MALVQRSRRSSDGKAPDTKQGGFRNRSVSIADMDSDIKVPSQKYLASRRNTISLETIKQRETAHGGFTFKHHFTERRSQYTLLGLELFDVKQIALAQADVYRERLKDILGSFFCVLHLRIQQR